MASSCVPHYLDSRYAISLMPLNITPGYKCPFCKCVVSKEMDKEYYPIFCPYCDIPMKRRHFEKKSKTETSESTKREDIITSECSPDCLKEDVNFSDIEDNNIDYIVLTDSEDEDGEKLKDLYSRIRKLAVVTTGDELEPIVLSSVGVEVRGNDRDSGEELEEEEGNEEEENIAEDDNSDINGE